MALNKEKTVRLVLAFPKELIDEFKDLVSKNQFTSESKMMKLSILEYMERQTGKDFSKYKNNL